MDLFNEGVDLPNIDTVMMLRPTESKILFLQQLGRGLRQSEASSIWSCWTSSATTRASCRSHRRCSAWAPRTRHWPISESKAEQGRLELPEGCYVNYDLANHRLPEVAGQLRGPQKDYEALRTSLGKASDSGGVLPFWCERASDAQQHGGWFEFVDIMGDLQEDELVVLDKDRKFLAEVEVTPMTKSFKMILLEALLELEGLSVRTDVSQLAARSWEVLQRRKPLFERPAAGNFASWRTASPYSGCGIGRPTQ